MKQENLRPPFQWTLKMKQQEQKQHQPSQNQIPNQVNNTKENSDAEATTYTNITHQKEVLTKKLESFKWKRRLGRCSILGQVQYRKSILMIWMEEIK